MQPVSTRSIPRLPAISLRRFTLEPTHAGGRHARKGFEFQDWYIAAKLASFAAGQEVLISCRIEGVEDLDALLWQDGTCLERYYQIKSKTEGSGTWTVALLDAEGVLARFFWLYQQFQERKLDANQHVELIVAVDGDLHEQFIALRDHTEEAPETKAKLFAALCVTALGSGHQDYTAVRTALRSWVETNATRLLHNEPAPWQSAALRSIQSKMSVSPDRLAEDLQRIVNSIVPLFDGFVASLRFESRQSSLEQVTLNYLMQSGDLSPEEAGTAAKHLMAAIVSESQQAVPTLISPALLHEWLGVPPRLQLQPKPILDANAVERTGLLQECSTLLSSNSFVLLHGLPKIGKSQLISSLIDNDQKSRDYFWFTGAGDPADTRRLAHQLALWCGVHHKAWQAWEDRNTLQPVTVFERLRNIAIQDAYIVIDDAHNVTDTHVFDQLHTLVCKTWTGSRLILISEEKLPAIIALGAMPYGISGLEPKEALILGTKLGCDLSRVFLEFTFLTVQVGGHPLMLRAILKQLPPKPLPADVNTLASDLPSIQSAAAFLQSLSNRIFFDLLRTASQRAWLTRLAVLNAPFTRGLALHLATIRPPLDISEEDWQYVASLILDQSREDHYSIPQLLRHITTTTLPGSETTVILIASARYVFKTALTSRQLDFLDFQGAIIALITAGQFDEAATWFILCYPSMMRTESFEPFELLFLVLNGRPIQQKLSDPMDRWILLHAEFYLRSQDKRPPDYKQLLTLVKRMRVLTRRQKDPRMRVRSRAMTHGALTIVRLRQYQDRGAIMRRDTVRVFATLEAALRNSLPDPDLTASMLNWYSDLHGLAVRPNLELLKEAILTMPQDQRLPMSGQALITTYANYVSTTDPAGAIETIERHAATYEEAGRHDAYVACQHALASIMRDNESKPAEARSRIEALLHRGDELQLSADTLVMADLFLADTYWIEENYAKAAEHYQSAASFHFDQQGINDIITLRLCDARIAIAQHTGAARAATHYLRAHRSELLPEYRGRLYARMAYAHAEAGDLRKAAIACQSLQRLAERTQCDQLYVLAINVAGWVVQHFQYSDPGIPQFNIPFPNSRALSNNYSAEEIGHYRTEDPLGIKAKLVVATAFDLLDEYSRGRHLYQTALETVRAATTDTATRQRFMYIIFLRLARLHLRHNNVAESARSFKPACDNALAIKEHEQPGTGKRAAGAYALLIMMEPTLQRCTDGCVIAWFQQLFECFSGDLAVQAWLRYRESELLFARLLVQAAKKRLLEAEDLACKSSDPDLYWLTVHERLFRRVEQFYPRPMEWLRASLEQCLRVAQPDADTSSRQRFADAVRGIAHSYASKPFSDIAATINWLSAQWEKNAFCVAAYGLWRAATTLGVVSSARNNLETWLRQNAAFLAPPDFQ